MKLPRYRVILLMQFIWPTEVIVVNLCMEVSEQIIHSTVCQCCYCQKIFPKNNEKMKIHMSICSAREGITYAFDNCQILNYQDNFKYLGDLPFTVYFDFETTTCGSSVFFFVFFLSNHVCDKLPSDLFISSVLKSR